MTANIKGVISTPGLNREGKAKSATQKQSKRANEADNRESAVEQAHTVELSPESISKAQRMVTGSGYISASDLADIDFTDEQALELSAEIARQMENLTGGLVQPPSAELTGMVG